ncbi:hypothetical protein OROHE_014389 [Orobanche hederae]
MALQFWETLKESITAYTGLSPATFFTVLAVGLTIYYVVSNLFGSSDDGHIQHRSRGFEEQTEPLPPPVQLGEITDDELKQYDGSDPKKPLLMAIKGQIYDVTQSRWNDMDIDILVKIFQNLSIFELTSGVGHICRTWRMAACDPLLWKTLDISLLNPERCPRLKRLVMPAWNRIKKTGICRAVRIWKDLESLTMPSISNPPYLIEEISNSCKKFAELKIMGPCDMLFASTLATYLPNLKVLSLRCSMLFKDALTIILDNLKGLEVLNISHCLVVEVPPHPAPRRVLSELDSSTRDKASRLKTFLTCMSNACIMCQRTRNDEGLIRWYKYEEDFWRVDEVGSLAF